MRVPPEAPKMRTASPFSSMTTVGDMEERGRFPGLAKLALEGSTSYKLAMFSYAKAPVLSLSKIPVEGERNTLPKL